MKIYTVENILLLLAGFQIVYLFLKLLNNLLNKPKAIKSLNKIDSITIINNFIKTQDTKIEIQIDKTVEFSFFENNTLFVNSQKAYIPLLPEIVHIQILLHYSTNWAVKYANTINTTKQAIWISFFISIIFVFHPNLSAIIFFWQIILLISQNILSYLPLLERIDISNQCIRSLIVSDYIDPSEKKDTKKYLQFWIWNSYFFKYNFEPNRHFID